MLLMCHPTAKKELVASLKVRLEAARAKCGTGANAPSPSPSSLSTNSHKKGQSHKKSSHDHDHSRGHIADIDMEQAKMLKRNFGGDEYDDYGEVKKRNNKNKKASNEKRPRVGEHVAPSSSEAEQCELCLENAQKHLIISMGKHVT